MSKTAYLDRLLWVRRPIDIENIKEQLTVTPFDFKSEPGPPLILYEEQKDYIGVPRMWGLQKTYLYDSIVDRTVLPEVPWPKLTFPKDGGYRKGQKESVDACVKNLKKYGTLLEAPTASGKTLMGLNIAERLQTSALVLVHKNDLADQWRETALGNPAKGKVGMFPGCRVGHIQADTWDFKNKHFTTALIQTLYSRLDSLTPEFLNSFGLIIVDESHHLSARTFEAVIRRMFARYRLGVSATFRRKDGTECVWRFHVGSIDHRMSTDRLTGKYVQIPWSTNLSDKFFYAGGNLNMAKYITAISKNVVYNQWLVEQLITGAKAGRKVLAVSDRIEQLVMLKAMILKRGVSAGLYVGAVPTGDFNGEGKPKTKALTKEQLEAAKQCDIMLASYGMISEGSDCPDLDTLFVLTPRSDMEQTVGRIQRFFPDKRDLLIVDVVLKTPWNIRMGDKRKQMYEKLGFKKGN